MIISPNISLFILLLYQCFPETKPIGCVYVYISMCLYLSLFPHLYLSIERDTCGDRDLKKERRGKHFIYFNTLLHRIVRTGTSESSRVYLKAGDPGRGDISVQSWVMVI